MSKALLFHALILTLWWRDSSCGARKRVQPNARARRQRADLLRDYAERVACGERRCLMAPLTARKTYADPTHCVAIKVAVRCAQRGESQEGAPAYWTLHSLL
jgi:hypothetical protein